MRRRNEIFFILFFFISSSCLAQEVPVTTQQQLENLTDENLEDDALLQQLDFYRKHPINLNTATTQELQPLRFLNGLQIANLINYRNIFGKLIDIYELQAVPGFDLLTIQRLQPYIYIGAATSVKENFLARFQGGDQYALFRISRTLEKAKGYDTSLNTHYLGDRNHLLFRYRYQYKSLLYYGIVADKDAGEQFLKGPQKLGFDFYSLHFFARNVGKIKALALGDYVVNLGQGLTQWQSLGFGKSVDVMNSKRQSPVLLPYRSAGEFYFNRGAAATIQLKNWEATAFISYKKFSGNLDTDTIDHFTSFGTSGYYRTKTEAADRYKLSDLSFGGNLTYQRGNLKTGVNAVTHQFSLPLQKRTEPYNYFAFSGKTTFNASLDYSFTYKNAHFFGEAAIDKSFHRSVVQGVLMSLNPRVDLSLLYRNLAKEYQSLFGNAFTENTLPGNEKGIYAGILIRPATSWQVAAYADFYQFHFLKYRVSAPSRGWDYLVQLTYVPDKKTEVYLRYRTENKPLNGAVMPMVMNYPLDKVKQSLRLHFSSQVNTTLSFKGRTEMIWYDKKGTGYEEGVLTYVEAAYQPLAKLKGNLRLQYFETGGYDSRIYAYESDVLYSFSIPAFFDKGFRYYLNVNYPVTKKLTAWLRIAQMLYIDKKIIGSGLDEFSGNKRTDLKLQFKYEF
jgi:hypothetical protein